jgi:O-antigen ligase
MPTNVNSSTQLSKKFDQTLFFIFCGFCLSVFVSQSLMDVFSTLLIGASVWAAIKLKQNLFSYLSRSEWIFIAIWILWLGVGLLFNGISVSETFVKLVEFKWLFTLTAAVFVFVRLQKTNSLGVWFKVFAGFFLFASSFAVLVYFLGFNPAHPGRVMDTFPDGTLRTGGFLAQPIVFGHLQTIFVLFFIGALLWLWNTFKAKWFWIVVVAMSLAALLLSFTRGAWIGLIAGLAILFWMKSKKLFVISSVLGALLIGSAYAFWGAFQSRIDYAFKGGDSERVYIWKANVEMFKEHPALGVGYGQNKNLMLEYYPKVNAPPGLLVSHAHNQYLEFLSGSGAIGLVFYLVFLFYPMLVAFKLLKNFIATDQFHSALLIGCIAALVSFIFGGLTEANFEHSKMKYAMIIIWGLILALRERQKTLSSIKSLFLN